MEKRERQSDYFRETIQPGDRVSALAKKVSRRSLHNTPALVPVERERGQFRGMVGINWNKHILKEMQRGRMYMIPQNDGDGHKPGCFTLLSDPRLFYLLPWEVIEMCFEDIVREGGLPVAMVANQIDFKRITEENFHLIRALFMGYAAALRKVGAANITGETAAMKLAITTFCDNGSNDQLILTWTGTALGLGHEKKELNSSLTEPGMPIVGLHERGGRCNGYTKLIALGVKKWGLENGKTNNPEALQYFRDLCIPSVNYSRTLTRVHGWLPDGRIRKADVEIAGIAHVTGGGVWGKFGEILPKGVGANLDKMPMPPRILKRAQALSYEVGDDKLTPITDADAYGDFHGGCGTLTIVKTKKSAHRLIEESAKDGVEASIVGETMVSRQNEILIDSRFREKRILSSNELKVH